MLKTKGTKYFIWWNSLYIVLYYGLLLLAVQYDVTVATGGSKYICSRPGCGRAYMYLSTLSTHQRYECGKSPQFQCSLCPYKAKQKGNLTRHMAGMHNAVSDQKQADSDINYV